MWYHNMITLMVFPSNLYCFLYCFFIESNQIFWFCNMTTAEFSNAITDHGYTFANHMKGKPRFLLCKICAYSLLLSFLYTPDTSEVCINWAGAGGTSNYKSVKKKTCSYGTLYFWLRTIIVRQKAGRTMNCYCMQYINWYQFSPTWFASCTMVGSMKIKVN